MKNLGFHSKLISYAEPVSKTESIYIYLKDFWDLDFSDEKVTTIPLRDGQNNDLRQNAVYII